MTLTLELLAKQEYVLRAKTEALGISPEQYAKQILDRDLDEGSNQSVIAMFEEIWSDMPNDVRAKLPHDGADQADHYVYGVPKREQ